MCVRERERERERERHTDRQREREREREREAYKPPPLLEVYVPQMGNSSGTFK